MRKFIIQDLISGYYYCGNDKIVQWSLEIYKARFYSTQKTCADLIRLNAQDEFCNKIIEIKTVYPIK